MPVLEVRCCCDADKLLGYLDVSEDHARPGQRLHYVLQSFSIERRPDDLASTAVPIGRAQIQLEVSGYSTGVLGINPKLAIKDNGATIEQLRRVPGFREHV